jgi:hypothetical protein
VRPDLPREREPRASSIAGQMRQWKRVMSLPITCRSAGHRALWPAGGKPVAVR